MSPLLRSLAAALAVAAAAAAQCQFSGISTQSFGTICNIGPTGCCAVPSAPTILAFGLDGPTCSLDVTVHALEGCCGIAVLARVVAIGAVQANIPLPEFGPGCTLWVQPIDLRGQATEVDRIPLPPTLPPGITFLAQAGALIYDPFVPPNLVVTLTHGQIVTLL